LNIDGAGGESIVRNHAIIVAGNVCA
jgi:hypothetical protein